jgi:hypothetical protein
VLFNAVGVELYLDGFQLEETFYPTPLCHGDRLGNAWTSTAHASTSSRTAARLRLLVAADTFDAGQGSICAIWKAPFHATTPGGVIQIWYNSATGLRASFNGADDKFYLSDNTNECSSSVQTFVRDNILILHYTWGGGAGLKQYINGSLNGSNATFTPPAAGTYLWIGSDAAAGGQSEGTYMDFAVYDRVLTATEIANDYNDKLQAINNGWRVGAILWGWTKDGDNVVDNCIQGTTYHNYMVLGGIPGSEPAETVLDLSMATTGGIVVEPYLTNLAMDTFKDPSGILFYDLSGTATGATDCGGEVTRVSVDSSEVDGASVTLPVDFYKYFDAKNITLLARVKDATGGDMVHARARFSWGGGTWDGDYIIVTTGAVYQLFACKAIAVPTKEDLLIGEGPITGPTTSKIILRLYRAAAAANIDIDWIALFPSPVSFLSMPNISTFTGIVKGRRGKLYSTSSPLGNIDVIGSEIELMPGKYNILMSAYTSTTVISWTLTYTAVYVTPKWALL